MATFAATQGMMNQRHFEVLEIDLPVITGACTIGSIGGAGTPLTCDQAWSGAYKTYYFTNINCPVPLPSINGEPIYRLIKSIKETSTEIKPGAGLASRSSLSIVMIDVKGQDPNMGAPGVTDKVRLQGSYLNKIFKRHIITNKRARLKLYRVEPDGGIDLVNGAQTRSFLTDTLSLNANGTWNFNFKDVLSLVNLEEKTWPITRGGFLRQDVTALANQLLVDEFVDWSTVEVVRIGDEHFRVNSVAGNLTSSAILNVSARGSDIVATNSGLVLTKTESDDHKAGDEVFFCDVCDQETYNSFLTRVLTDSDFPSALIIGQNWLDEVNEWHSNDKINTIHSESEDVNAVISRVLSASLMDLWFSVTENTARLSAISVHKKSAQVLTEGKEINAGTMKRVAKESLRATRALVLYDKRNLSDSDDVASFKKGSQFSDNTLIGEHLNVKHKDKIFDRNHLLDKDAADLLTQRHVSRFKFTPYERPFICDEQYMTFNVGDIVDIRSTIDKDAFGAPSGDIRGQVTRITPKYKNGRKYDVKVATYEAAFDSGAEIVLDSPLGSVNLFILAGAPSQPIELTFVFDGSYSFGDVAIKAGQFATGSKLIIILANGFDGQATGGVGGRGEEILYSGESSTWESVQPSTDGGNGGVVYDAMGVTTDIYFSGVTTSTLYPTADGYIRAPGAGGTGTDSNQEGGSASIGYGGNSGGGGAGRLPGIGGIVGSAFDETGGKTAVDGGAGSSGDILGNGGASNSITQSPAAETGGDWGENKTGALAGSGIIDSGATVTLFGNNATRYINGNGNH